MRIAGIVLIVFFTSQYIRKIEPFHLPSFHGVKPALPVTRIFNLADSDTRMFGYSDIRIDLVVKMFGYSDGSDIQTFGLEGQSDGSDFKTFGLSDIRMVRTIPMFRLSAYAEASADKS